MPLRSGEVQAIVERIDRHSIFVMLFDGENATGKIYYWEDTDKSAVILSDPRLDEFVYCRWNKAIFGRGFLY